MRDQVRRRVGLGLCETAQALVIYVKRSALYALYVARYPTHKISFALFKKLAPWLLCPPTAAYCLHICSEAIACSDVSPWTHLALPP